MAYTFDGATNYLTCSSAPVTSGAATVACWFSIASAGLGNTQMLAILNDNTRGTGNIYARRLWFTSSAVQASQISNSVSGSSTSSITISDTAWHHAAGVFATTTSRTAYCDGVAATTNTTSISTPTTVNALNIAATINSTTTNRYLNGSVCEVGVWSAALTGDEIASLSKGVSCDKIRPDSLVFYAPLIRDLVDAARGLAISNVNAATASDNPRVYL